MKCPKIDMENMGESKTITQGTKWEKTKPLHWNFGEHGK